MGHQDGQDDPKKQQRQSLKPVAFAATVFSTVAITSCLVTFPLILHYVQTLESNVQLDLDFCKVSIRVCRFYGKKPDRNDFPQNPRSNFLGANDEFESHF